MRMADEGLDEARQARLLELFNPAFDQLRLDGGLESGAEEDSQKAARTDARTGARTGAGGGQ